MNNTLRIVLGVSALLPLGCGGGDSGSSDLGVDAGAPDEDVGEQPVFADLSAAVQIDRVGKPLVATIVIPTAECGVTGESCRTTYHHAESPADDSSDFAAIAVGQLSGPDAAPIASALWQGALLTDAEAASFVIAVWGNGGDMLVLDTSAAPGYSVVAGGRAPTDDVLDTTLDAITVLSASEGNMTGVASDSIDANDKAFSSEFPYFDEANP